MSSREIITIQCGHYANFVGTHWWNLQESAFCYDGTSKEPKEIATDCTFREGLTLKGEQTYTPRLLALDLNGSLHSLKQDGHLYDNPDTPHSAWQEKLEVHTADAPERNVFLTDLQLLDTGKMNVKDMESKMYELNTSVKVWSDFLRIHLHPKTLLTIPGQFHGDDSSFHTYPAGHGAWDRQFKECFEERLRFFAEECDSLQGFQLLVDSDTGFAGLAGCLSAELADEYSQKGVLAIPLSPNTRPLDQTKNRHSTMLNQAMCLDDLCTHSSLVCPMSLLENPWRSHTHSNIRTFQSVQYEHSLPYHTSAVMAAALETATLIYRVHQPPLSLSAMADSLAKMGRKVCGMGVCLPLPLPPDSSLLAEFDHTPLHLRLNPLTPFCSATDQRWTQCLSLRGVPPSYALCSSQDSRWSYCGRHISLALSSHLSHHFPSSTTATHFNTTHKPLVVGNPFPHILPRHYHQHREVPCSAGFQSLSGVGDMLGALATELKGFDVRRLPSYSTTLLDRDAYMQLQDRLVTTRDAYRDGPDLDESSDSD